MTLGPIPPRGELSQLTLSPPTVPELERVKTIYNNVGGVIVDSAFLGLDAKAMASVEEIVVSCSGAFQSGVGHRQHMLMSERRPRNSGGRLIHELVEESGLLSTLQEIVGVELVPYASFVNISAPGEDHPPHHDWSFSEPSWISLVRQVAADCEPLFHIRNKTTREWEIIDQSGDRWLLLDGFTDHLVRPTSVPRRSLVIGFSPTDPSIALMSRDQYFEARPKT